MRKLAPTRVSYRDDCLILYHVYMTTGLSHISLFEGTLHLDKIHVWFKITNITHAPPVPVYRQTDVTPKRVVLFAFTWYCCEISYRSEIFARVQEPGWTHAGVTCGRMTLCGGIMSTNIEPWEVTGVNSLWGESRPVSYKHPLRCNQEQTSSISWWPAAVERRSLGNEFLVFCCIPWLAKWRSFPSHQECKHPQGKTVFPPLGDCQWDPAFLYQAKCWDRYRQRHTRAVGHKS